MTIDIHVHPAFYEPINANAAREELRHRELDIHRNGLAPLEHVFNQMRCASLDRLCLLAQDYSSAMGVPLVSNEEVAQLVSLAPDRFWGVASVDPLDWRLPPEYRRFNYAGQQISLRPWIYAVSRRTVSAWTVRFVFSSPEDRTAFQTDDEEYGLPERVFAAWCQYKYPDFELEVHKIYVTPKGLICHTEVPAPVGEDLIVCSAGDMLAIVNQPDGLRSENFPRLEDSAYCASCRFRELCDSEPVPPVPEEEPTKPNTD